MIDKGSQIRNTILATLSVVWLLIHLFKIIFEAIASSKT